MKRILLLIASLFTLSGALTLDSATQFKVLLSEKYGNKGYTILRLSGSDSARGVWYGKYFAKDIFALVQDMKLRTWPIAKNYTGLYHSENWFKRKFYNATVAYMPTSFLHELGGMHYALSYYFPTMTIDYYDLYLLQAWPDFFRGLLFCRAYGAWGNYVSSPIKMVVSRRADYGYAFTNHFTIIVNVPDDGKKPFVNVDMAGFIHASTTVKRDGTLLGSNDNLSSDDGWIRFDTTGNTINQMAMMTAVRHFTQNNITNVINVTDSIYRYIKSKRWVHPAYLYSFHPDSQKAGIYRMIYDTTRSIHFYPPAKWNSKAILCANDNMTQQNSNGYAMQDSATYNTLFSSARYSAGDLTIDSLWNVDSSFTCLYKLTMEYRDTTDIRFYFRGRKTQEPTTDRFRRLSFTMNYLLTDTNTIIIADTTRHTKIKGYNQGYKHAFTGEYGEW
jgi:hypothetical protein